MSFAMAGTESPPARRTAIVSRRSNRPASILAGRTNRNHFLGNTSFMPTETAAGLVTQGPTPPLRLRDFKLIAFDMDSTLINIECIDEIADAAGRKAEVAAITEAAMRGDIPGLVKASW